jgi:Matrixin
MRTSRLNLEVLEDRTAPAVFGIPWPDASHLTLSFVPDGTITGESVSDLFSTLNALFPTEVWQREVLRAFQTWAIEANVNIGLVTDNGQPLGTGGAPQGDDRFGDIRLASYALSPEVDALASPFDVFGGTWSGDVKLNSLLFSGDSVPDLFSVLLHEAGHVFGLDHSTDPASPLFETYLGIRTALTEADISRLQELYGPRQQDSFDARAANDTQADAAFVSPAGSSALLSLTADLTTHQDVDWYSFQTGNKGEDVVVRLRTAGISLLSARLSVYDATGNLLGTVTAPAPGEDLELRLAGPHAPSRWYVKVEGATEDVFGIGSYQLEIDPGARTGNAGGSSPDTGPPGLAGPTGTTFNAPIPLAQRVFRTDARFDYTVSGILDGAEDARYYRVKSPSPGQGEANVMTVMAWSTSGSGNSPLVSVFDVSGNPVSSEILVRQDGTFVIQITGAAPNTQYIVAIQGDGDGPLPYFLGVDFGVTDAELTTFVEGQAPAQGDVGTAELSVLETRLFHFILNVDGGSETAVVTLEVLDQAGNPLSSLSVVSGEARSFQLLLRPGSYQFRLITTAAGNEPPHFTLRGIDLDDPIGPQLLDPTLDPLSSSGNTTDGLAYLWAQGHSLFLSVVAPPPADPADTGTTTAAPGTPVLPVSPPPILSPMPPALSFGPVLPGLSGAALSTFSGNPASAVAAGLSNSGAARVALAASNGTLRGTSLAPIFNSFLSNTGPLFVVLPALSPVLSTTLGQGRSLEPVSVPFELPSRSLARLSTLVPMQEGRQSSQRTETGEDRDNAEKQGTTEKDTPATPEADTEEDDAPEDPASVEAPEQPAESSDGSS